MLQRRTCARPTPYCVHSHPNPPPSPPQKKGPSLNFAQLDGPESDLLHRIHCPYLNFKGSPVLHHQSASRYGSLIERCLFGSGHASALCCARCQVLVARVRCVARRNEGRRGTGEKKDNIVTPHTCHKVTKKHATKRRCEAKTQGGREEEAMDCICCREVALAREVTMATRGHRGDWKKDLTRRDGYGGMS